MPTADQVSATVAVAAAVLVGIEYLSQRTQARLQRATELERRLDEDPILRFAVQCLDWGGGALPVPQEYLHFVGQPLIDHDRKLLFLALRPRLPGSIAADRRGLFYRQAFVALFNHLERTVQLIRGGHVSMSDLPQTRWIIRQLVNWEYADHDVPVRDWFIPALESWYKKAFEDKAKVRWKWKRRGQAKSLSAVIIELAEELAKIERRRSAGTTKNPGGGPSPPSDLTPGAANPVNSV